MKDGTAIGGGRRGLAFCGVLAACVLHAGAARAAPSARLVYSRSVGAEACPDESALRAAVAARIGYDAFFPWAPRTIVAQITLRGGELVASVELVDENGVSHGAHEIHAHKACAEALDAAALAIAIAIDPRSIAGPIKPEPEPAAAPAPPSSPPPPPVPPEPPPPLPAPQPEVRPHEDRVAVAGSAGVVASDNVAPSVAFGLALGADLRWRALSIGLEGRVDAPASAEVAAGGRVSSWLLTGSVVPCVHAWLLFACGLAQGGSMQTSGEGVSNTRSIALGRWALGGRLGGFIPLTESLQLRPHVDVLADLRRATLTLDGEPAWTEPRLGESLGLDLVVRIW